MSAATTTPLSLDPLEEIFLKVEEESERRAQAKTGSLVEPLSGQDSLRSSAHQRARLSVSRFGEKVADIASDSGSRVPPVPDLGPTFPSSTSRFYQSRIKPSSTNSLLYDDNTEPWTDEDEHHITRIERLPATRTLANVLGEVLSRIAHGSSANPLSLRDTDVNIGVSVKYATADSPNDEEDVDRGKEPTESSGRFQVRSSTPPASIPRKEPASAWAALTRSVSQKIQWTFKRASPKRTAPATGPPVP